MPDRPVYHFDADRLDALIRAKCRTDDRFRGTTIAERARMCDVSETTYKSIVSGRNPAPRLDIIYNIVATFGGSIDALVGIDAHNGVQEAAGGAQSAETDKYRENVPPERGTGTGGGEAPQRQGRKPGAAYARGLYKPQNRCGFCGAVRGDLRVCADCVHDMGI